MLTPDDHKLLHFEHTLGALPRWRKEDRIRRQLGITETRYYQRLLKLIELPETVAVYPQVVYRVRERVERKVAAAQERRLIR